MQQYPDFPSVYQDVFANDQNQAASHNNPPVCSSALGEDLNAPSVAIALRFDLFAFVYPLLIALDKAIDRRLVRTFLCTLEAIVKLRHRANGLLLSELGAYLMPPEHAPAGTKRLSNLLHSAKWKAAIIHTFLWRQALQRHQQMQQNEEQALILWDESVIEKPESIQAEGLCAVRSSKAKRLTHIKPGFFTPPTTKPIFVPGLNWISLLLCGPTGSPVVAAMQWWSTRGVLAKEKRVVQIDLLKQCMTILGGQVLHVFDRGYAGKPWLEQLWQAEAHFLMRWPSRYHLVADGDPLWQTRRACDLVRGKRSVDHRLIRDAPHGCSRKLGLVYLRVWDTSLQHRLWLVVCRRGDGKEPWYLLTSEPIQSVADGWRMVMAYARRWQIEQCWRFNKSELAMESPRLWHWEQREKLLLMVTLVYAFLLSLLHAKWNILRLWLLRHFCHRTGKRSRQTAAPLYRLRAALSRLWCLPLTPTIKPTQAQPQNSG